MARNSKAPKGHTGTTSGGNTRDVKVERIDRVTIYKRGKTYSVYYREDGKSIRRKIEGNLAVARATATKVAASLQEGRASPLTFQQTTPQSLVAQYLDYIAEVQGLAWRTQDRYRAALNQFLAFCDEHSIARVDALDELVVENFVRWLRGQRRTRNGARAGRKSSYQIGGVKFILSTCRTVFNWAGRRRMMPPYAENPFSTFPIDQLRDSDSEDAGDRVFTPQQEKAFFNACSDWHRTLFEPLATYGMRVGELTHLLIDDIDFRHGVIYIRSKPDLYWRVKTSRRREIPLTSRMKLLLEEMIKGRRAGFVLVNDQFFDGTKLPCEQFATHSNFLARLREISENVALGSADASPKDCRRAVIAFCRQMGQVPDKRIRDELKKLTAKIGCPEFTRAHDLRHLFSSRAQEEGMNPILVQEILGHANLNMTRRYTHLGIDAKREAIEKLNHSTKEN